MSPSTAERYLKWFLLLMGAITCLAFIAVFMPTDWMEAANDASGLGPFPRAPLTEYLTRSLSTVYGLFGVLTVYLGLNVRRYLDLIVLVGWMTMVLGALLTGIDLRAGMPASWVWGEGPPTVLIGAAFIWLARQVDARRGATGGGT